MSLEISTETTFLLDMTNAGFISEYQTIYDSFTTPPSASVAAAQNTMVESLVDSGAWAKLDIFYMFAQESNGASEALKNWVSPGTFDATAVSAPVWTSLEGYAGDGAADYVNTNWNPNTDGVNSVLDSASLGIYLRTNVAETVFDIGCKAAGEQKIATRTAGDVYLAKINDSAADLGPATTDSRGMHILTRTASNARALYKNKISLANDTQVSSAVPSQDIYVLCVNNAGSAAFFSSKQASVAFASSGFTQTNVDNLTDAVEVYMDSNGKGVIT